MLAKILEDMWVEPEVLEALSEEQKRILFLKMREEQVRRWTEREKREEREGGEPSKRPKKADNKRVKWQLGRDGDVSVIVIGEVDEFRSSKLLQTLMNNRVHSDTEHGVHAVDLLSGRESKQLTFKEELPLADAIEAPSSSSPHDNWSEEDSCSAEDDPKDPAEDSGSESGGSSDTRGDWTPLRGPRASSHGNRPPPEAQLSDAERPGPQDGERSQYGGRVAQLKKQFAADAHSPPAYTKPPVPTKPAHLQRRSAPVIHSD